MTAPSISVVGGFIFVSPPPTVHDAMRDRRKSWDRWMELVGYDYTKTIRATWEFVVFVARYASQRIDDVERWPISKVVRVAKMASELMMEEAKKASAPQGQRSGGSW